MWIAFLGASAGLGAVALVIVWFGVRVSRAVRRNHDQLDELTRRVECVAAGTAAISAGQLCSLLPEVCDAAIVSASKAICFYQHLEQTASPKDLEALERMTFGPFAGGLGPGDNLLPSQMLGLSLAGLRALKHRFHASDAKTFSRKVAWVLTSGKHDRFRQRLLGEVSSSDDPIPVVQEEEHEQRRDRESERGDS